jgi:hypothetical protein
MRSRVCSALRVRLQRSWLLSQVLASVQSGAQGGIDGCQVCAELAVFGNGVQWVFGIILVGAPDGQSSVVPQAD